MGADTDLVEINSMPDKTLQEFLSGNAISLKTSEARKIVKLIGRNPTLTELHIFNIQWSEHSSYKSSRKVLKQLPTKAPNVILGPVEDSGIVELGRINGEKYGIVVSHESHNHPSQVVPYEGAATGIGGILRDVLCMGSRILATADPLRFGNPHGNNKNKVKYIANEVINGIAGYGNAVGVPNIAGDVYFNESFDDNCLVNVVCLGIVKEKDIIHSYAPRNADGHDIIVVGKPTDNSGFGGAAFASLILDEKENNKGAVQVPDPFLKNVLIRATYEVFNDARRQNVELGFKDMGAGGIMCATSELCSDSNFGAEIDLDKVHVSMDIPGFIIACSETQERFAWISPKSFTKSILKIYNEDFELGNVAVGAKAVVVGKVTKEKIYLLTCKGKVVCNAPIKAITSGISYDRKSKPVKKSLKEPKIREKGNYNEIGLKILGHPNIASKAKCYNHYDKNVQGNSIIESGQADAGLIKAVDGSRYGVALSVDNNPRYGKISPYWGAVNAVAESMRNVAAIGAVPSALTDCLNFGNPEKEEAFWEFKEAVRGIKDAASKLNYYNTKNPVPIISGNVSFYNESKNGKAIDPSPVIACVGVMEDYSKAIDMKIKKANSTMLLVGNRKDELGGSVYYDLFNQLGKNIPKIEFVESKNMIYGILDCISKGLLLSCHDISDGGMFTALAEMILGGNADGHIGMEIDFNYPNLKNDRILFSESPGFVLEVGKHDAKKVQSIFKKHKLFAHQLGKTTKEDSLKIINNKSKIIDLKIEDMKKAWTQGFPEALE
jgi:phosphoribosylformylglycinamidine synthase subunit PurL